MHDDDDDATVIGQREDVLASATSRDRATLTAIAGPGQGEMFKVNGQAVVGRGEGADIRIIDDQISRRHARIVVDRGGVYVEDLESKNGTFVNGERVSTRKLGDGDKVQLGTQTVLRFALQDHLEESFQQRMIDRAMRDELTKIYNRRFLFDRLTSEVAYSLRHGAPLSLVIFDIDHFKQINTNHLHPGGDFVLVHLTQVVGRSLRGEDVFARMGGEEFAIIARGLGAQHGGELAERVRQIVASHAFVYEGKHIPVTISAGVATTALPMARTTEGLVMAADEAMFQAKNTGRNRVIIRG